MLGLIKKIGIVVVLVVAGLFSWGYVKTGHVPDAQFFAAQLKHYVSGNVLATVEKDASGQLLNDAKKMINKISDSDIASPDGANVKIYKWKDEKGIVHFDNHPVKGAQEMNVDTRINVVPATEVKHEDTAATSLSSSQQKADELAEMKRQRMEQIINQ